MDFRMYMILIGKTSVNGRVRGLLLPGFGKVAAKEYEQDSIEDYV
jgi:hypothetical protein